MPTFRRYVQGGKINPSHVVGRNQFFAAKVLRLFKRSLREVRGRVGKDGVRPSEG